MAVWLRARDSVLGAEMLGRPCVSYFHAAAIVHSEGALLIASLLERYIQACHLNIIRALRHGILHFCARVFTNLDVWAPRDFLNLKGIDDDDVGGIFFYDSHDRWKACHGEGIVVLGLRLAG